MKALDKITTVAFWVVACSIAVLVAGDALRRAYLFNQPWLAVGAIVLCIVAAFGARQCRRAIRQPAKTRNAV